MNEKMDLFRCDGCDHSGHEYGCYSWIANGDTPENCVTNVNGNDNVNWQKTTACEITKPVHDPEKCKTCGPNSEQRLEPFFISKKNQEKFQNRWMIF